MMALCKLLRFKYLSASPLLVLTSGLDESRAVGDWKLIHLKGYTQMVLLESLKTDLKACCIGRALSNLYGAKLCNEN